MYHDSYRTKDIILCTIHNIYIYHSWHNCIGYIYIIYIYIMYYPPTPADSRGNASEKRVQEMTQEMDEENQSQEHEQETRSKTKQASCKKKVSRKRKTKQASCKKKSSRKRKQL